MQSRCDCANGYSVFLINVVVGQSIELVCDTIGCGRLSLYTDGVCSWVAATS